MIATLISMNTPSKLKLSLVFALFLGTQTDVKAQRNLKVIPSSDPAVEKATFVVPEGFEVNLYASDPQLAKPIHMNFDAQGQLWIASSEVYPHIKPGQKATDKIIVLKDTNGDGRADKRTVFVDNLLIPTGVVPGDGGVYVANSTDLIHYSDTNGDGMSDRKRVVLSGFGTEDTHHLLHTLRWGPDGALYMNQSIYIHSHVETPTGVKRLLGGGIWRFRPETMELEVFCRGFVNPWGHHFDYWGQSFATDGAFVEGINYVFPGAVFRAAPNEPRFLAGLNPGSPKHCGLEILSGRHLPPSWSGSMIANDFRGNRVCRFVVNENAAGYSSKQETELIKSSHVAFRPIDVKMGPDGAIYIADWYNPIIQHGEVDFRDERRDHVHGRIWRITAKDRELLKLPRFSELTINELLQHLEARENWVRLYAKLELKTRNAEEVVTAVSDWIARLDPDNELYNHNLLEGMWALQNVLHIDRSLTDRLVHNPDHRVRAAAIRLASVRRDKIPNHNQYFILGARDEHPRVRLEAVRALAENKDLQSVSAIAGVLNMPMDRFLDFAVWRALRDNREIWLPRVQSGAYTFNGDSRQLLFALRAIDNSDVGKTLTSILAEQKEISNESFELATAIGQHGDKASIETALLWLLTRGREFDEALAQVTTLNLIDASIRRDQTPLGSAAIAERFVELEWRLPLIRAISPWKLEPLYDYVYKLASKESNLQLPALRALGTIKTKESITLLKGFLASDNANLRGQSIIALTRNSLSAGIDAMIADLQREDTVAEATLAIALASKQGHEMLLQKLQLVKMPSDNAKLAISLTRETGNDLPSLIDAFRKAGNVSEAGWQLTDELLTELIKDVRTFGDPHLGQEIYRRKNLQCMQCHAIGGAGGKVGPDLISIGASAPIDYLIESLIVPNAKIKENFHAVQILDVDGQITSGIVIQSDDNRLQLRTAKNQIVSIPKSDIDLQKESRSLMPDGTVDELTRNELVNLVAFLTQLGKIGDFEISKEQYARSWEVLQVSQETRRVLNRTGIDSAAKEATEFNWENLYANVQGYVPTKTLPQIAPHTADNPFSFMRANLEVTQPGNLYLTLENAEGILLWFDGKPTPIQDGRARIEPTNGTHRIVIGIQHAVRQSASVRVNAKASPQSTVQFQWAQ